jgi:hypothetical protein
MMSWLVTSPSFYTTISLQFNHSIAHFTAVVVSVHSFPKKQPSLLQECYHEQAVARPTHSNCAFCSFIYTISSHHLH